MNTSDSLFPLDFEKIQKAQNVVQTLDNPRRRRIIDLLESFGPQTVEFIADRINMDKYATIRHLKALREIGVVETTVRDAEVFYGLNYDRLYRIQNALHDFPD